MTDTLTAAESKVPKRPATAGPFGAAGRPRTAGERSQAMLRRYKQLEANHKAWQEEKLKELKHQKQEIDSLRRDNEPLKQTVNELRAAEATTAQAAPGSLRGSHRQGMRKHKEVEAKREMLVHLQAKLQHQQQRNADVEALIEDSRKKTKVARKSMNGVNVVEESNLMVAKQVQVLENRLDQSLQRFNDVLRQNKELRDQIDTLRGEREVFDEIYLKLEAELQEKKKEMAFIIEVSNIAYEECDNNKNVLANLRNFAAEEMQSFAETFKELDELLEEDRRMKEQVRSRLAAMEKKERPTIDDDLARDRFGTKKPAAAKATSGATVAAGSGGPKAAAGDGDDEAVSQARQCEEVFSRILETSADSIPDLDTLVQRFLTSEEDNFSLFSYVNDKGKEIEQLEKVRAQQLAEIDEVTLGNEADQARRVQLKQLEDELWGEENKNQAAVESALKCESILRSIMTTVENIFTRLDCDESTVIEHHGIAGLTMESLLLYLAAIELRTDEYLVAWSRANNDPGVRGGPAIPFESMQVTVDTKRLPGTGEEADSGDDDTRPLTHEQLKERARAKFSGAHATTERRQIRTKKNLHSSKKLALPAS